MNENEVAAVVVDSAIEVHRTLGGAGLLEAVYEEALVFELGAGGLAVTYNRLFEAQAPTYLRLTDRKLALVINSASST
jgi:hypothetical protein